MKSETLTEVAKGPDPKGKVTANDDDHIWTIKMISYSGKESDTIPIVEPYIDDFPTPKNLFIHGENRGTSHVITFNAITEIGEPS